MKALAAMAVLALSGLCACASDKSPFQATWYFSPSTSSETPGDASEKRACEAPRRDAAANPGKPPGAVGIYLAILNDSGDPHTITSIAVNNATPVTLDCNLPSGGLVVLPAEAYQSSGPIDCIIPVRLAISTADGKKTLEMNVSGALPSALPRDWPRNCGIRQQGRRYPP
jgi:hypothetical protein